MASRDILLVFPKTGFDVGGAIAPPHSLLTISAPLVNEGYNIKIIDQRVDPDWQKDIRTELKKNPLCVGLCSMSGTQIKFALAATRIVKEYSEEMPVIWGGTHPTIMPVQTLEHPLIDFVVEGEGEETFYELIKAIENETGFEHINGLHWKDKEGNIHSNPQRQLMNIEGLYPTPWQLINPRDYIYRDFYMRDVSRTMDIGQTSRGCPFTCTYCASAHIRQIWRPMSTMKAAEKIINDVHDFNLDSIWIRDDNFYANLKRSKEICDELIKEKVDIKWYASGSRADSIMRMTPEQITTFKKAGAEVFKIGAESGSDRILKFVDKKSTVMNTLLANKKATKYDIIPAFSFMGGFPTETPNELMETINCMIKVRKDSHLAQVESLCIFTPYPGTPIYQVAIDHGLKPPQDLESWSDWGFHDSNDARNPWLTPERRDQLENICYISSLASIVNNLSGSINNPLKRTLLKSISYPLSKYYQFRFDHKIFNSMPERNFLRFIRRNIFDTVKVKEQ